MKAIPTTLFFLFFTLFLQAQVGIGTLFPDGALDITSPNDGLVIPRIALTATTTVLPVISGVESELIYNTATAGDVTPGFYYLSTATGPWVRLNTPAVVTNNWTITGNSNIVDGTNYIGTSAGTNVDVAFRRNNIPAGKISTTSTSFGLNALSVGSLTNSTAFGTNALTANTSGSDNVAFGNNTLATNSVGSANTALGKGALFANTASGNTALGTNALTANTLGSDNVAIGNGTLSSNISGVQNTAIGSTSLSSNTGSFSTAVGFESLKTNTSGTSNTAVGYQSLRANLGASNNVAMGYQSLFNNNSGSGNTASGYQSSFANTSGSRNTVLGMQALSTNTTGNENIALGHSALGRNSGSFNTVIGFESMFGATSAASNSTAVGWHALFGNSANNNTAVGYNALQGNAGATGNTAVGAAALNNNATGINNTSVGNQAGFGSTNTSNNTYIGYFAGQFSTGSNNTALGFSALLANGASANSVAIGYRALILSNAANNTAIGYNALASNITGTGNVAIGYQAGSSETTSDKLYITNSATTPTTSLVYGEFTPAARIFRTNSTFQIGDPVGTGYVFPVARGLNTQVLTSNASGVLSWATPNSTYSSARFNINANQALNNTGWQKINFNQLIYDSNNEISSGTFTATKAGNYNVNAGFHTDDQSNFQFYSIGVYVNGVLYQQSSGNHGSNGPVFRNINCNVNLAVGGTIEIYVENYQTSVNIDSFSAKTYFEIQQNK